MRLWAFRGRDCPWLSNDIRSKMNDKISLKRNVRSQKELWSQIKRCHPTRGSKGNNCKKLFQIDGKMETDKKVTKSLEYPLHTYDAHSMRKLFFMISLPLIGQVTCIALKILI